MDSMFRHNWQINVILIMSIKEMPADCFKILNYEISINDKKNSLTAAWSISTHTALKLSKSIFVI